MHWLASSAVRGNPIPTCELSPSLLDLFCVSSHLFTFLVNLGKSLYSHNVMANTDTI